jgi:hypothetical protein
MIKTFFNLTLILLSLAISVPAIANPDRSSLTNVDRGVYKYQYADGAGNLYVIRLESIEYYPITRAESSSGNYDGGIYRKVQLTQRQYRELAGSIDRAFKLHSIDPRNSNIGRAKGTGAIFKQINNRKVRSQIIAQNSRSQIEIEALLKQLISSQPEEVMP